MRKVIASLFVSMDGVAESPDQWQFDAFDEDMGTEMMEQLSQVDTLLLGRVTYEEWKDYWPNAQQDLDFAAFINNTPKYVVSDTLDSVEWGDYDTVHLIKGDPTAEIKRLKAQPGKNISISGSPGLVRSLIQLGLVDEFIPLIHPVVAGKGKRLFGDGDDLKRFKLVRSKITSSGVAILTYVPHE
ncbi:MAG: riboflavin biosynthesis protein RibD [Anaerolineaceae bacterium]|nr:riboflavin biosynthesis protein RibD [Anaerolineaceae bacterium]